jgi:hypothetical protein
MSECPYKKLTCADFHVDVYSGCARYKSATVRGAFAVPDKNKNLIREGILSWENLKMELLERQRVLFTTSSYLLKQLKELTIPHK